MLTVYISSLTFHVCVKFEKFDQGNLDFIYFLNIHHLIRIQQMVFLFEMFSQIPKDQLLFTVLANQLLIEAHFLPILLVLNF